MNLKTLVSISVLEFTCFSYVFSCFLLAVAVEFGSQYQCGRMLGGKTRLLMTYYPSIDGR